MKIKIILSLLVFCFSVLWISQPTKNVKADYTVFMPVPKACKLKDGTVYSYGSTCEGTGEGCEPKDCPEPE